MCEKSLIIRRVERDISVNVNTFLYKVPVIIVRFQWNLDFVEGPSKNTQMSNSIKTPRLKIELHYADGRMDSHVEANNHFFKYCGSTKKPHSNPLHLPYHTYYINVIYIYIN